MPPPPTEKPKPTGLNVIALISGGKDSLYSILHCIRNGHNVVALANLHPPLRPNTTTTTSPNPNKTINHGAAQDDLSENESKSKSEAQTQTQAPEGEGEDDIDSFMYQTIGWGVIPLYETALGIPLYRAPICGGAVDTGRVYGDDVESGSVSGDADGDETESLVPLLRRVMEAHPEANAVCAGAILSTYQRTRIESVAGRLGLVPLAWLWMYTVLPGPEGGGGEGGGGRETGLLDDMAGCGCEARIVKVASGALDEGFLWGDVAGVDGVVRRRIARGMGRFVVGEGEDIRGSVLGEGGEYETLAVDGPGFLWKGRIVVAGEEREVRIGEGGVAYLRIRGARCVMKSDPDGDGVTPESVRRPALLDGRFAAVLDGMCVGDGKEDEGERALVERTRPSSTLPESVRSENGGIWTISNITAPEAGPGAGEQMAAIAQKIQAILDDASVRDGRTGPQTTADIVFTTVLLRSMADFPLMNSIYVSLFKKPNPPARATVACGDSLPEGVDVMISIVVDTGERARRQGLHVQSRSYWAPANIGPYSQAMSVPVQGTERLVYIAGQIPLEPASMDLVERHGDSAWAETYCLRAVLSLQHMWRIGAAMEVGWWLGAVAFFTGTDHISTRARLAWSLWEKMHGRSTQEDEDEEESTLDAWDIKYGRRGHEQTKAATAPQLPNFELVEADDLSTQAPAFFAVQIDELPRDSAIEWQGLGYRCEGLKMTRRETELGRTIDVTTNGNLRYSCIEVDQGPPGFELESRVQSVLAAYSVQLGVSHCVIYTSHALSQDCCPGQVVPCKSVWGAEGRELAAGVILQTAEVMSTSAWIPRERRRTLA